MPAAAVIPAPIAYIKVVAVKKLVVGFLSETSGLPRVASTSSFLASSWGTSAHFIVWLGNLDFYFEEMRVLQAGVRHEYVSME
ncbi:hypothetical protein BTZ53_25315 [Vibrio parahaemolyticus]|nr:hypothetical protein BTZ53_25315 [Vibrio parahaemolyticus]